MQQVEKAELFAGIELVDHHCHGVIEHQPTAAEFADLISESSWPQAPGVDAFDSQVGVAIRRWCAPQLGLAPFADAAAYLERRAELGAVRVNEILLRGAGIGRYLIETGYRGNDILQPAEMAVRAQSTADRVVRLERIAEQVIEGMADAGDSPALYPELFREALAVALVDAVGVKSIAAYRCGLDFDPARPSADEVVNAATRLLRARGAGRAVRVADPALIRFGIWAAVDARQAVQFHIGYGDPDVDLHRCNPLLLTEFLRLTRESGARVLLLHCYPFHREAGYLAHVFPHVYCDVGLAVNYVGAQATQVLAESLELTPLGKAVFSSDAFGLPELYFLGAELFKNGLTRVLNGWISAGEWDVATAKRFVRMICVENAVRAYGLSPVAQFDGRVK